MGLNDKQLSQYGFSLDRGKTHCARTIMLDELEVLLAFVNRPEADKNDYLQAITVENCLGKRSVKNRMLTYRHLVALYSLDPRKLLFRALLYFWNRDIAGRPLLALLCAYSRDPIFRAAVPFILNIPESTIVSRVSLEEFIDSQDPGRFSKATLTSTAQNINSSLNKSGHLEGRIVKTRSLAKATAGSVSYALLLGYLNGVRGKALFQTEYTRLLDCTFDKIIELAETASRKGWIVFKRINDIFEVLFPNLINQEEMEWLREQN